MESITSNNYLIVTSCFSRKGLTHLKTFQIFYGIGGFPPSQHYSEGTKKTKTNQLTTVAAGRKAIKDRGPISFVPTILQFTSF